MNEWSLVELARLFADARGISLWRVGYLAADDGKFVSRLESGRTCTLRRARAVVQYFSDHWPDGPDWPPHIPRPAPRPGGPDRPADRSGPSPPTHFS